MRAIPARPHEDEAPQTNGICKRFHKMALQEFYQVAFRKKTPNRLDKLQEDFDNRMA